MNKSPTLLGILGSLLVLAFFLPWLDIAGIVGLSGWDIMSGEGTTLSTRGVLLLCPLLGGAMAVTGFAKSASAPKVALVTGGLIIGYTAYKVGYAFFKVTGLGLWLVLGIGALALVAGLSTRKS